MTFPILRMRRLRRTRALRDFVSETRLSVDKLVYPLFIADRPEPRRPVTSMPGVSQLSLDETVREVETAMRFGVKAFLLFGIPDEKDAEATSAWFEEGIVQQALRRLRTEFGDDVILIADTCLCEYMTHGHCGIVMDGKVLNDPSVELLGRVALSQAQAGADIVAPSDMLDGRIGYIRDVLDEEGYQDVPVMSYAAKYASAFYGPFRDAAESAPSFGDRRTYQMDVRNSREALEEIALDLQEGADMIIIKPGLPCLDIITKARQEFRVPIAAYTVSGEYAMIKAAVENGWLDERAVVLESLTALARAGADILITYHAVDVARWLSDADEDTGIG